jgi:hypothetical protein
MEDEPHEPLRIGYSRAAILQCAQDWMRKNYPTDDKEAWNSRFGLLIDFLTDHFPNE